MFLCCYKYLIVADLLDYIIIIIGILNSFELQCTIQYYN